MNANNVASVLAQQELLGDMKVSILVRGVINVVSGPESLFATEEVSENMIKHEKVQMNPKYRFIAPALVKNIVQTRL